MSEQQSNPNIIERIDEANRTAATVLDLSQMILDEIPDTVRRLTSLTVLDVSNNQLTELPEWLCELAQLEQLHLSNNNIQVLPDFICDLSNLRKLTLYNNQLEVLPTWLEDFYQLTSLSIGHNRLNALPDWLTQWTQLHEIGIAGFKLHQVPAWLSSFSELRCLDISSNQLSELPEFLGDLTKLQILDFSCNKLSQLPNQLGKLTYLQKLSLWDNLLNELPEELGSLASLHTLDLSSNQLNRLPKTLNKLKELQFLNLRNNKLSELPEELYRLINLQVIDLRNNKLSKLPERLSKLPHLERLLLSSNQLDKLPDDLCSYSNLQALSLSYNRLTALPERLGNISTLRTLSLSRNQLNELPDGLGDLVNLQALDLSHNQLRSLPESVGNLARLQELNLRNNQLQDVPNTIVELAQLTNFDLTQNVLYPEIGASYARGADALMRYLRARAKEEIVLHEAKLIFVGEGTVGKSSLLGKLRGETWIEDRKTTHGIDIKDLSLSQSGESETLTLKAWDFGGQPVYRPTHQLFFSAPAVYLVVWKPRDGENQSFVHYWIEQIKHRTYDGVRPDQRPRVIVVATHGGPNERQPHIDESSLRNEFGDMIVGFHLVDSYTGLGIPELKQMIAQAMSKIPQVGRTVPASAKRVIEAIHQCSKNNPYLSYSQFEQLCQSQRVDTELAALYAAILNELGYCIHYQYDETLKGMMILKPDWLAKAISFVLEDHKTIMQNGLVTHKRLSQLWHDSTRAEHYPPRLHPLFLRLMECFDLSYRIRLEGRPSTSLIAQLVPDQRPEHFTTAWAEEVGPDESERMQVCRIVDRESRALVSVPSVFYNLIVRLHRFSLGRDDYQYSVHWKNGLLLDDSYNGQAFVEQVRDGIRVTVRAIRPQWFLQYLCSEVEWLIDDGWKGLNCEISVPCRTKDCPGLFRIEMLIKTSAYSHGTVCQDCLEFQEIDILIGESASASKTEKMFKEILENQDEMKHSLTEGFDRTSRQFKELRSRLDECFDQLMRTFVDEGRGGPRLFSITPISSGSNWSMESVRLTLWCEHSHLPVPLLSGNAEKGVYEIKMPREWLIKIAPYVRSTTNILRGALSIAGSVLNWSLDEQTLDTYSRDLELSKQLFGSLLDLVSTGNQWLSENDELRMPDRPNEAASVERLPIGSRDAFLAESAQEYGDLTRLEGAPLRQLHTFLKKQDITFGELERVQNNRREFLWVHSKYKKEYNLDSPKVP